MDLKILVQNAHRFFKPMDLRSEMLDLDPKIWQKHLIYIPVITFLKALSTVKMFI